jgi:lipoic acid synthetase
MPPASPSQPLRIRWLGRVAYGEAWDLQQALFTGSDDHLLLLEHPPTYTLGRRTRAEHLLVEPSAVGAEMHRVNRGGDVTFHGPGQLVGYPILSVPGRRGGGMADTKAYVCSVEQALIDALAELGLDATRLSGEPGVWLDADGPRARKIAAIGVRLSRGRSMHGFALNVDVDLDWFGHIIPCGIVDKGVTSLRAEGIEASMQEVAEVVARHAARHLAPGRTVDRADVVWRSSDDDLAAFSRGLGPGAPITPKALPVTPKPGPERAGVPVQLGRRLDQAGVDDGLDPGARKPEWMRVKLRTDPEFLRLKKVSRELDLVTVCEEAGCPNIFDCWNEGTATFMLLGDRCTRACGFCLIDTRKPLAPDLEEPSRIADAVERLGLSFAVLTMVARDDLTDGGATVVADTVRAIRERVPDTGVEVLISDLKGSEKSLQIVADAAPDVLNHNIETVPRLQRAVRPSAGYARSLTVLARARDAGLTTKSGIIVGMGERFDEVVSTLADLAAVGVDIVTIGQYLRPTTHHLPIHRWWTPEEFDELKRIGEAELGIAHVESSPLTRSSHHAGSAAASAGVR